MYHSSWTRIIWLAPLLLVAACSSAKKKAIELLEKENYEEAASQFAALLEKDPQDTELKTLLESARRGAIDRRYIRVRMDRLAGNRESALDQLREAALKQAEWNLSLDSKVAFTANEERVLNWPYFERSIQSALKENYPVQAEWRLRKYQFLFSQEPSRERVLIPFREATEKQGKVLCIHLVNSAQKELPWSISHVAQVCQLFGILPQALPVADPEVLSLQAEMQFQSLESHLKIETLSGNEKQLTETAFATGFRASPWISANARHPLPIEISGRLLDQIRKTPTYLSHPYTETETYEEFETVSRIRKVPVHAMESVRQPDGSSKLESVTRFREESYLIQEKVQKKRLVARNFRFPALYIEQEMSLDLQADAQLSLTPFVYRFAKKEQRRGNEHHQLKPEWGLKPARVDLLQSAPFVTSSLALITEEFRAALVQNWVTTFCHPTARLSIQKRNPNLSLDPEKALFERAEVCLHGIGVKDPAPSFAEELYHNRLGLSVHQWRELSQLKKLPGAG